MRTLFKSMVITASVLGLAACNTSREAISIDKAKKITASFEGSAFTPPPRAINDILDILKEDTTADTGFLNKHKEQVKRPLPSNADDEEFSRFYLARAMSRIQLGQMKNTLTDIRLSLKHLNNVPANARYADQQLRRLESRVRHIAGKIERVNGNFRKSIDIYAEGLEGRPNFSLMARQARAYQVLGDLEKAEEFKQEAISFATRIIGNTRASARGQVSAQRIIAQLEAETLQAEGRWQEAEPFIRAMIALQPRWQEVNPTIPDWQIFGLKTWLAKNLLRQGRMSEAESLFRDALKGTIRSQGLFFPVTAGKIKGLAFAMTAQGRNEDALKLLNVALGIFKKMKYLPGSFAIEGTRMNMAANYVSLGRWKEAADLFEIVQKNMTRNPEILEKWISGQGGVPISLIKSGRAKEAAALLNDLYQSSATKLGVKHGKTARLGGMLAMAYAELGKKRQALDMFRKSVPILLSRSRQSDSEEASNSVREQRLTWVLNAYIKLLSEIQGTAMEKEASIDAVNVAFMMADTARSRGVQGAVTSSGARAVAGNAGLADLVRREQDAQKSISALLGLLANIISAPSDQQDKAALSSLRTRIDSLRQARAALAEQIEKDFPDYAELTNPKPASIEKIQKTLSAGEALVSTYVVKNQTYVWAVPKSGKPLFTVSRLGGTRIASVVSELRKSLDPQAATLGEIPPYNVGLSYRLYREILEPVAGAWKSAHSLVIVPHGALGQLPFATLVTKRTALSQEKGALFANYKKVPWLARSHGITVLPSVTSMVSLRALPPSNPKRRAFAGFGDPFFSVEQANDNSKPKNVEVAALTSRGVFNVRGMPVSLRAAPKTANMASADLSKLPRLPDTSDEIRNIALTLNADLTRDVFTGVRATEANVKAANLSGYKVITFATHGLVPGDLNGLRQPALAMSTPKLGGSSKDDGLLTMSEILSLRLDADWVVLSACNTGSGKGAGAEAFSGLGRAFFYAGTRALLLSNWPVETTSAKLLTTEIFKRQKGNSSLSRSDALKLSMLSLIDGDGFVDKKTDKIVFSYAHPIFWAPFTLLGDGGGGKPAS